MADFQFFVLIGFPQQCEHLEFGWGVGRGHDPADQVPVFDQGAFIGIARKSLRFGGVMTPPYETPRQTPIYRAARENRYAHSFYR
ncbi:hypothetical protein MR626_13735 [bacterium]|nr:hypothetical protein [bacterium]